MLSCLPPHLSLTLYWNTPGKYGIMLNILVNCLLHNSPYSLLRVIIFSYWVLNSRLPFLGGPHISLESAYKILTKKYLQDGHMFGLKLQKMPGYVLHVWWTCQKQNGFWCKAFSLLHTLFRIRFSRDPWLTLLHFKPPGVTKRHFKRIHFIF